jgi:predicted oxidoreductase (fatty acid repression mutant protein)
LALSLLTESRRNPPAFFITIKSTANMNQDHLQTIKERYYINWIKENAAACKKAIETALQAIIESELTAFDGNNAYILECYKQELHQALLGRLTAAELIEYKEGNKDITLDENYNRRIAHMETVMAVTKDYVIESITRRYSLYDK